MHLHSRITKISPTAWRPGAYIGLLLTIFLIADNVTSSLSFDRNSSRPLSAGIPIGSEALHRTGKAWSVPFNTELLRQQYSKPLKKSGDSIVTSDDGNDSFSPSSASLRESSLAHQTSAYSPEAYGKPFRKGQKYSYSYLYPQESIHKPTFSAVTSADSDTSTSSATTEPYPAAGYFSASDLKNHRLTSSSNSGYKTGGSGSSGSGSGSSSGGVKFPSKSYDYTYDYSKYANAHYPSSSEYGYQPTPSGSSSSSGPTKRDEYHNTGAPSASSIAPSFSKPSSSDSHRFGGYYPHNDYLGGSRYSASTLQAKKNKLPSSLSAQHLPRPGHHRHHGHDSGSDERPDIPMLPPPPHELSFRDELEGMYGDAPPPPPPGYPLVGFIERDDHEYHPLASHKYIEKYHPPPHVIKFIDYLHHHMPYHHHPPHKKSSYSGFGLLLGLLPLGLLAATLMPSMMAMPVTVASGRKRRDAESPVDPSEPRDPRKEQIERVFYNHPVLDRIARYGMTSLDDPDCLQQIFCEITTDGKTNRSNVVQKIFYKLVSWTKEDVADKLGMKPLVLAVQQDQCEVFHCSGRSTKKLQQSTGNRTQETRKRR